MASNKGAERMPRTPVLTPLGYRVAIGLTEKDRKFIFRALARNIPEAKAIELLYWQKEGLVNLSSFFDIPKKAVKK